MPEFPIIGFAPDMPQGTPGVVTSSSAILPTMRGIGNGVGVVIGLSSASIGSIAYGGAYLTTLAGPRKFIGTATSLWEQTGSQADISGKAYSAGIGASWSFTQFGAIALAANINDTLQASTAPLVTFADVAGAPKANVIVTVGKPNATFAMMFDYDDGTRTKDGIFWSGIGDYTAWTPSIATQCGKVRLLDINGPITAAIPYRDGVICWKANAMYQGTYVGAPDLWAWRRISSDVGCIGKNACCEINERIYFADANGVWMFDGSYPQLLPGAVNQWWASNMGVLAASSSKEFVRVTWDKPNNQVWFGYGYPQVTQYVVYHTLAQRWTQYQTLSDAASTYVIGELYDPAHAVTMGPSPKFVSLSRFSANVPDASFTLSASGKTYGMTTFRGMRPQFEVGPSDTTTGWVIGTLYHGKSLRNVTSQSDAMTFTPPGKFECVRQDRFVAPSMTFPGSVPWEISSIAMDTAYNATGE